MPVLIYQLRAVALVILCLVAGTAWAADPDVRGIDVSDNNGRVDWNQVKKDGLVFSFIKATDGISYPEVWYFNENWPKMKAAGIVRGAFHYYEPSNDPIEQANYFADTLLKAGFEDGDMPPVLDIELDGGLGTAIPF